MFLKVLILLYLGVGVYIFFTIKRKLGDGTWESDDIGNEMLESTMKNNPMIVFTICLLLGGFVVTIVYVASTSKWLYKKGLSTKISANIFNSIENIFASTDKEELIPGDKTKLKKIAKEEKEYIASIKALIEESAIGDNKEKMGVLLSKINRIEKKHRDDLTKLGRAEKEIKMLLMRSPEERYIMEQSKEKIS